MKLILLLGLMTIIIYESVYFVPLSAILFMFLAIRTNFYNSTWLGFAVGIGRDLGLGFNIGLSALVFVLWAGVIEMLRKWFDINGNLHVLISSACLLTLLYFVNGKFNPVWIIFGSAIVLFLKNILPVHE
jgi:hypothetical protein